MQDKIKVCKICGKEFTTCNPNSSYCSFICKAAGTKIRRKKWQATNPGYNTEYMRKYRATQKETSNK